MRFKVRERGQVATEYMLVVSVVVLALVAASYSYVPRFKLAVFDLSERVQLILYTGSVGGAGAAGDGSLGGDFDEDGRRGAAYRRPDPVSAPLEDGEL